MRIPAAVLTLAIGLLVGCTGGDASSAEAPADPNPLEGAWQIVEANPALDGSVDTSPEPGLRLFIDGHYSLISDNGAAPRVAFTPSTTPDEQSAALQVMTAQSGTYGVAGDTLTTRPLVAKNPSVMTPGSFTTIAYGIAGDTLTTVQIANTDGAIANPLSNKFVRLRKLAERGPLDGAWRTVAITTTGPEGATNAAPEPGLRLYVDGHYSLLQLTRTRGPQPDSTSTDEDRVEVWSALTANAGTFAVSGDTVRSVAFVAMSPAVMAPGRTGTVRTWRMQADTLWLTAIANQDGPIANPTTETFVRAR